MNRDVIVLREAIVKIAQMLSEMNIRVTQIGMRAYVEADRTGKPIRVNLPYIPDNASEGLVIAIQGFLDHEVAHVLFTDFKAVKAAYKISRRMGNLHNIIEDTYIERMMRRKFPGSNYNLARLHDFFIKEFTEPQLEKAMESGDERMLLSALLVPAMRAWSGQTAFIDYMSDKWHLIKTYVDRIDDLKDEVIKVKNSWEGLDLAKRMYEAMKLKEEKIPESPSNTLRSKEEQQEQEEGQEQSAGGSSGDQSDDQDNQNDADQNDADQSDAGDSDSDEGEESEGAGGSEGDEKEDGDEQDGSGGSSGEDEESDDSASDSGEETKEGDDIEESEDGDGGDNQTDKDSGDESGDFDAGADGEGADDPEQSAGESVEKDDGDDGEDEGSSSGSGDDDTQEEEGTGSLGDDGGSESEGEDAGDDAGDQDDVLDGHEAEPGDHSAGEDEEPGEGAEESSAESSGGDARSDDEGLDGKDEAGEEASDDSEESDGDPAEEGDGDADAMAEEQGFPFIDDALDEHKDYDEIIARELTEKSTKIASKADYLVYTKDWDKIEPLDASMTYFGPKVAEVEDTTREMVGVMQKDLERAIAAQSRVRFTSGHRSGRLDGAAMTRVLMKREDVFRRKEVSKSRSTAVQLLVDCSGSMTEEKKIKVAAIAAFALVSVIERIGVACEVIGFTTYTWDYYEARRRMEDITKEEARIGRKFSRVEPIYMPIIKGWNERLTPSVKCRFPALYCEGVELRNNIDGECLEYAAQRLLQRTEDRKIMIVLSDGYPAAYGNMSELSWHLQHTVKNIEKTGIEVVGIGIKSDDVRYYYHKHVVLHRVEELPAVVMKQLSAYLLGK